MSHRHDLVILGSGTTAFAAALKGAQQGARVLMVEQGRLGGTCVNWGCVPSKTLIHLAELHFSAQRAAPFGLNIEAAFPDCGRLMAAKQQVVDTLRKEVYPTISDGLRLAALDNVRRQESGGYVVSKGVGRGNFSGWIEKPAHHDPLTGRWVTAGPLPAITRTPDVAAPGQQTGRASSSNG